MNAIYVWIVIVGLMVMVLAMRWSFLLLPRRFQPKGALAKALSFAPLSALIAICAPEVFKLQLPVLTDLSSFSIANVWNDWRLWAGCTMLLVTFSTRHSKSANLFGLVAAALVVWWVG